MVDDGVTVIVLVVSPVFQTLDLPPFTERVTELPIQMVVSLVTVVATVGRIETVTVSVVAHLPFSLLVTVYVVVCEGVTVIEDVVAPLLQTLDVPPLTVRVAD